MKILGVIPARYAYESTPDRLLMKVNGKSVIQLMYEQSLKARSLSDLVIATDSEVIENHVKSFGGNVVMTSVGLPGGIDFCAEAFARMGGTVNFDFVVNIQTDVLPLNSDNIDRLASSFTISSEISSVYTKIIETDVLLNPNVVKVVINEQGEALYFSRSPIPHMREEAVDTWVTRADYFQHLGIYGFRSDILEKIVKLPLARLEKLEKLKQLRWVANGYKIKMVEVSSNGIGIHTEEDFVRLKQFLKGK